jgi:hypothetical protein
MVEWHVNDNEFEKDLEGMGSWPNRGAAPSFVWKETAKNLCQYGLT